MKVYGAVKAKAVVVKKSKIENLLSFGETNLFPQSLIEVCGESETATRCLSVRKQFIEGNGFLVDELANMVIHRSGLTVDGLLSKTARNVSKLEVVTLLVGYNALGKIAHISPVYGEMVRLQEPDEFGNITGGGVCPYLSSDYDKSKKDFVTYLPFYNPNPEIVLEQINRAGGIENYRGQLLYMPVSEYEPGYYHIPSYYNSGRLPIQTEAQLSIYDWKTVENGFNVSGFLATVETDESKREDYIPANDPNSIEAQLSQNQGAENGGNVLTFRGTKDEIEAMRWIETNGANLADRYNSTATRTERKICRSMNVPMELAMVQQAGGLTFASDSALKTASQYMQLQSNPIQRGLSQLFRSMLSNWKDPLNFTDCSINVLNYFPEGVKNDVAQPK